MKLHLINPNSTEAMTRSIAGIARAEVSSGTELLVSTVGQAPLSIEGYSDEALAVPEMLARIVEIDRQSVGAHVIACFDDPGLDAAREVASAPVVGLCEAALIAAARIAKRFSIVTSLERSVPIVEDLADRYGCGRRLIRVRHADVPVLDLESDDETSLRKVSDAVRAAATEDRAEAVVLGCAGMSAHLRRFARDSGVPVIDGVAFAVRLAEAFAGARLTTSKVNGYAFPRSKPGGRSVHGSGNVQSGVETLT